MNDIIKSSFDNSFDIILGGVVVGWAFIFSRRVVLGIIEDKFSYRDLSFIFVFLSYLISIVASAGISTGIFVLRTLHESPKREDYVYCLTAFFILIIPSVIGLTYTYIKEADKNSSGEG